ncbi:type III polyketide synthase [bacterium]|nr:type III polyketide synthase [bacterium]
MSYITSVGTALPIYQYRQEEIANFMRDYLGADERIDRMLRILYAKSAIDQRYSVLPDFSLRYPNHLLFNGLQAHLGKRMQLFGEEAPELALKAAVNAMHDVEIKSITHLITVSCTGMSAPGLEIQLQQKLGLSDDVIRLSVNFMGCYAAFHALRIADSLCRSEHNARVLIVCVELCSIHFLKNTSEDNLRANALFADGAAAIIVSSKTLQPVKWEIKRFFSRLMPKGQNEMAWEIGDDAFKMKLTSYIPELVKEGVKPLIEGCMQAASLEKEDINHWAIHPGGVKILNAVEEVMQLDAQALDIPRNILRQYGNMSSPTIIFVLKELWDARFNGRDDLIFAAGFGPGLTLESCLIEQTSPH